MVGMLWPFWPKCAKSIAAAVGDAAGRFYNIGLLSFYGSIGRRFIQLTDLTMVRYQFMGPRNFSSTQELYGKVGMVGNYQDGKHALLMSLFVSFQDDLKSK